MTPPSSASLGRAYPLLHCASLHPPVLFPLPLFPESKGAWAACWILEHARSCHIQRAVPKCPAFRWEQRVAWSDTALRAHPPTTEWLERGDGCFFLLGSSLEVRGWGWLFPLQPELCPCPSHPGVVRVWVRARSLYCSFQTAQSKQTALR